jgi:hypothetical protein
MSDQDDDKKPDTKSSKPEEVIPDVDRTLIVVSDTGEVYKLTEKQWKEAGTPLTPVEKGVVEALTKWGSYMAYIPPDAKIGVGAVCTVINLKSILKNQK